MIVLHLINVFIGLWEETFVYSNKDLYLDEITWVG